MLNDPLYLGTTDGSQASRSSAISSLSELLTFHTVSTGDGVSRRTGLWVDGSTPVELTISHSSTKENAPYATVRSLVRLDLRRVDLQGRTVTLSAYAVVAFPQGEQFSDADAAHAAATLGFFLSFGKANSSSGMGSTLEDTVERVLNGEP